MGWANGEEEPGRSDDLGWVGGIGDLPPYPWRTVAAREESSVEWRVEWNVEWRSDGGRMADQRCSPRSLRSFLYLCVARRIRLCCLRKLEKYL